MAVFFVGINDVGNSYWNGVATPIEKVHDQYFAQLQILHDAGIRIFTLFTVPIPFSQAPVLNLKSNIAAFNDDLTTRLATFLAANSGTTSTIFNTDDSMSTVLDSPTTYDATDATV